MNNFEDYDYEIKDEIINEVNEANEIMKNEVNEVNESFYGINKTSMFHSNDNPLLKLKDIVCDSSKKISIRLDAIQYMTKIPMSNLSDVMKDCFYCIGKDSTISLGDKLEIGKLDISPIFIRQAYEIFFSGIKTIPYLPNTRLKLAKFISEYPGTFYNESLEYLSETPTDINEECLKIDIFNAPESVLFEFSTTQVPTSVLLKFKKHIRNYISSIFNVMPKTDVHLITSDREVFREFASTYINKDELISTFGDINVNVDELIEEYADSIFTKSNDEEDEYVIYNLQSKI